MSKASFRKSLSKIFKPTKTKVSKDSYTIAVPHFRSLSLNSYLVFVIIIFAFILGMLTIKVLDLQNQVNSNKNASAAVAQNGGNTIPSAIPTPAGPVNVAIGNYPIKGNANAKVTVIEFADFRCPFCEEWFKTIETGLMKDYVDTGKVKFTFRNYAFLGPASVLAANAGECANEQGKFWDFHDYMYKNQPDESDTSMFTVDSLSQIAGNLGMDQSQFQSCLSSKKYDKDVSKDLSDGQTAGVSGTPTTFINGIAIVGAVPYDQIKSAIDNALK
jgi:protein-disulfide isomerase